MVILTYFVLSATTSCLGVDIFFQLLLQKCRPQLLIDGVQNVNYKRLYELLLHCDKKQ